MNTPFCQCRPRDRVINGRNPSRCYRCALDLHPDDQPKFPAPAR